MSEARNGLGTGLTFEEVIDCIRKEGEYSKGWGGKDGKRKISLIEGVKDQDVHAGTTGPAGSPFSLGDWWVFAKKYWDEIPLAMSNFTPDGGSVRIRMIKVASLIVRALMIYGRPSDIERLAGVSSSEFPILGGGLKTFNDLSNQHGCLLPGPETKALRNEAPGCNPLSS
jgi:hypothetical protein